MCQKGVDSPEYFFLMEITLKGMILTETALLFSCHSMIGFSSVHALHSIRAAYGNHVSISSVPWTPKEKSKVKPH